MSDKGLAKAAAGLAVDKIGSLIRDAGPIYMSALGAVELIIQQSIDEAYTTRFQADTIEFVDMDASDRVTK